MHIFAVRICDLILKTFSGISLALIAGCKPAIFVDEGVVIYFGFFVV